MLRERGAVVDDVYFETGSRCVTQAVFQFTIPCLPGAGISWAPPQLANSRGVVWEVPEFKLRPLVKLFANKIPK